MTTDIPRSYPIPTPVLGRAPEAGSLEYWKARALSAEAQIRELQRKSSDDGWRLENYRKDAQDRRDREIGEMGGGG